MNPNEIQITVSGLAGSGKSGIGQLIENILRMSGLRATFIDLDCPSQEVTMDRIGRVVSSLREKETHIKIIEQQARRNMQ